MFVSVSLNRKKVFLLFFAYQCANQTLFVEVDIMQIYINIDKRNCYLFVSTDIDLCIPSDHGFMTMCVYLSEVSPVSAKS